jgi:PAS domain S-box-containing protein
LTNLGKAAIGGFLVKDAGPEVTRRLSLVLFISLLGTIVLLPLAAVAFAKGSRLLALLDVTLALILVLNLVHLRIYRKYLLTIYSGTFFTGLLFVFALATGGVAQTGFMWYFTFPLISCYLLGSRRATLANGLLLIPALFTFFAPDLPPLFASYSADFIIRFLPAFFVIFAFSYLFERQRERSEHQLSQKNRELMASVEELNRKEAALRESHLLLEKRVRERTAELSSANEELEGEIAERRRAEEALELKNLILTTQQETSLDAILVVDQDGAIVSRNGKFQDLWRTSEEVMASGSDEGSVPSDLDTRVGPEGRLEKVHYLYSHPGVKSTEELKLKDGRVIDRYSSPIVGSDGKHYGRVWYFRDITERKRSEEALRSSEKRYRTLIAQAGDSLFILDPTVEGGPVIVEANEKACFDHGYSMDELIGKPISELDDKDSAALVKERVNRLMSGKAVTFEASHQRKDGSTFPVEVSARLITLSGKPYIFALDRDITERKQAEKALKIAKEELERQNRELKKLDLMKDALISDVSHELKTPVAKHIMQMEVLKGRLGEDAGDGISEILQVMEASINRQQNVIHNILMMSRLESGPREYERSRLRLDELIEEIRADFAHLFSAAGITVNSRSEEAVVLANKDMLWHVYSNIFNNAIKYRTREDPRVTVTIGSNGEYAQVSITDNGVGMTAEDQEKAFQRFYQCSPAKEGIGLGLNISRMIIERFGGTIRVSSEGPGRGAQVITELPLAP